MRIAVVGWGSLIWDAGVLRIENGEWHVGGPPLPIELSRVSKRRGYLTYVIDERHSRPVPTRFAISKSSTLEDAVANLACREGCPAHCIGFVEAGRATPYRSRTAQWRAIHEWLGNAPGLLHGAIWTDLEPRFDGPFTLEGAVEFWRGMSADVESAARRYAELAPSEVDTDLRRRLRQEGLIGGPVKHGVASDDSVHGPRADISGDREV